MNESMHKYARIGLVHFMAYPETMAGEGPIVEAVRQTLCDDYFDFIELTHIADIETRRRVLSMVRQSGAGIGFGAQPQLLRTRANLNSLDEAERQQAVRQMQQYIDEAYEMGAEGCAFLAGRFEPGREEEAYRALVESTMTLCGYAEKFGDMPLMLEVFDYDIEKCALIGPPALARRYVREICGKYPSFGLMVDLSHITQLHGTMDANIDPIAAYIRHAHIANAVLKEGAAAYGDQHPRFGVPYSEVDATLLAAFLRKLFAIGYLGTGKRPVISFEVKPMQGEDSGLVLANAKRMLNAAWALV